MKNPRRCSNIEGTCVAQGFCFPVPSRHVTSRYVKLRLNAHVDVDIDVQLSVIEICPKWHRLACNLTVQCVEGANSNLVEINLPSEYAELRSSDL